jgi:hypothetical protein
VIIVLLQAASVKLILLCLVVLHPQYKSLYFHKVGWPQSWITVAEQCLCDEWELNYKPTDTLIEKTAMMVSWSAVFTNRPQAYLLFTQASLSHNKYFNSLDGFDPVSPSGDMIDEWLSTPPIPNIGNGLHYWSAMATSGHPLAPMAKDFLSIPGA